MQFYQRSITINCSVVLMFTDSFSSSVQPLPVSFFTIFQIYFYPNIGFL
jgi:hypothetical protein